MEIREVAWDFSGLQLAVLCHSVQPNFCKAGTFTGNCRVIPDGAEGHPAFCLKKLTSSGEGEGFRVECDLKHSEE